MVVFKINCDGGSLEHHNSSKTDIIDHQQDNIQFYSYGTKFEINDIEAMIINDDGEFEKYDDQNENVFQNEEVFYIVSLTKDPMDRTLYKNKINNGLKLLNCPIDERKMKYFKIDQYPRSILSYLVKDDMVYLKNLN